MRFPFLNFRNSTVYFHHLYFLIATTLPNDNEPVSPGVFANVPNPMVPLNQMIKSKSEDEIKETRMRERNNKKYISACFKNTRLGAQ